ncbi:MAG: cell division protein FtsZ [Pseudomonadota bacterium]
MKEGEMPIDFETENLTELRPKITVIGVGGAGGNAIDNMISADLRGVDFVVANTDAQALTKSRAGERVQLGLSQTKGLGAGARPEVGAAAAEEALADVQSLMNGSNMVFITAGMGGGTGTGAAPVIAKAAREMGILTVGVVTKPFQFEGRMRMRAAERGIEELQRNVDTLIVIPNQNLFRLADENTTLVDAFAMADDVLHSGVRGITDLMLAEGLVNLDFADICTAMSEMGKAMMGTGESDGDRRATEAAEAAISNPLLDEVSLKGAKGVVVNVTGGHDLKLWEIDEAVTHISDQVDPEANVIFGAALDPELDGRFRITVVATGIDAEAQVAPNPRELMAKKEAEALAVVVEEDEGPAEKIALKVVGDDVAAAAMTGVSAATATAPLDLGSVAVEAPAEKAAPFVPQPAMTVDVPAVEANAPITAPQSQKDVPPSLFDMVKRGLGGKTETAAEPQAQQAAEEVTITTKEPVTPAADAPAQTPAKPADGDRELEIPNFLFRQVN